MSTYDNSQFIKATLDPSLDGDIQTACMNLSYILGDINGKIPQSTANGVVAALNITSTGAISTPDIISSALNPFHYRSSALPTESLTAQVAPKTVETYNRIKSNDLTLVVVTTLNATSPILDQWGSLPPNLKSSLSIVYLECLSLYLELLSCTKGTGLSTLTKGDITRTDFTMRWITGNLSDPSYDAYDLMQDLRGVQRTLMYVRYLDYLFAKTYSSQVTDYSSYKEVRDYGI